MDGEEEEPVTPAGRFFLQPDVEAIINCVIGLKLPIDIESIKAEICKTLLNHPRFCSILVKDKRGVECWRRTHVDIDQHMIFPSQFQVNDGNEEEVDEEDDGVSVNCYLAELAVSSPLDLKKPPWEIHVLKSRRCCVLRLHHALGDGTSLMSLFLASCRRVDEPDQLPTLPTGKSTNTSRARRGLAEKVWEWTAVVCLTVVYVVEFVLRSLWVRDGKTAISGGAGVEMWPRKVATARFDLQDMKSVKKAVNGTINDVLFGIISYGLAKYLKLRSSRELEGLLRITGLALVNTRQLPGLQDPSNMMKKGSKSRWGNQMGYVVLPIYLGKVEDPLKYLRRAKAMLDRKKRSLEARFSYWMGSLVMSLLGPKIATILNYRIIANTTFTISNLVGPQEEIMFAGNPIAYLRTTSTSLPHVLGVDKNASQRDIQKAFHKLSLKYHPDKNKEKGSQEKFSEINNAYEILSDEEKRKNYDLYGDEKASPNFDAGSYGDREGYTYFTSGGQGNSRFTFKPDGWQTMGGQGYSKSFSFSFGNPSASGSASGFSLNDIFSNFFQGYAKGSDQFGGFGSQGKSKSWFSSSGTIKAINSELFKKDILDQGMTWLLLVYSPSMKKYDKLESIVQEVADSLQGALKVGSVNCQNEQTFCKDLGIAPSRLPRLFIYSYKTTERGSLVEYNGEWDGKSLKNFCQDQFPSVSRRINLHRFDFSSSTKGNLPQVLLLSAKKDTPVIWRVLSGLYHKRFVFFDAEVHDVSDPVLKKLGVNALPAVIGRLSNGEMHVLRTGTVKDLKSGISELRALLDGFEKKNKQAASSQASRPSHYGSQQTYKIPVLTGSNVESICNDDTVVCIIGIFRSSKAKEKLESILYTVSQKTLTRQQSQLSNSRDAVSYSMLDASKQTTFLDAFDRSGFKYLDKLIVAYKPRKGTFVVFKDELTFEGTEGFIGSVLSGDIQFKKVRQNPIIK